MQRGFVEVLGFPPDPVRNRHAYPSPVPAPQSTVECENRSMRRSLELSAPPKRTRWHEAVAAIGGSRQAAFAQGWHPSEGRE